MSNKHDALSESPLLGRGRGEATLSRSLSKKSHLSEPTIRAVLDALATHLTDTLARGENVTLPGVGTFAVHDRKARIYHNVRHPGVMMQCDEHAVVKFKPSAALIDNLNAQSLTRQFKRPAK